MKWVSLSIVFLLLVQMATVVLRAQDARTGVERQKSDFAIAEQGEHYNVLRRLVRLPRPDGEGEMVRTNSIVQLESGVNYRDAFGLWRPSEAVFRLVNGEAIADEIPHKVKLPGRLDSGTHFEVTLPDGQVMTSRVFGLAYYDPESGQSILIAELTGANGVMIAPNRIAYTNAFANDFEADLIFTVRRNGVEQDVVLREKPPGPEVFGLPKSSRIEVWTEFLGTPQPAVEREVLNKEEVANGGQAPLTDDTLDFGPMQMERGRAFDDETPMESLAIVAKEWFLNPDGRKFLIETVAVEAVASALENLPASQGGAFLQRKKMNGRAVVFAPKTKRSIPSEPSGEIQIAAAGTMGQRPGLTIDYSLISGSSNFTFRSGSTYYVTGPITFTGSGTTFEPSVVIKMARTNAPKITVNTPITCLAGPYRPVVITGSDDASVGELVTSQTPLTYYADIALEINTSSAFDLNYFRIRQATKAIRLAGTGAATVRNLQVVNCQEGLRVDSPNLSVAVRNALFHNVSSTFLTSQTGTAVRAEHLTVNTATWLNPNTALAVYLTNSILAAVGNTNPLAGSNSVGITATPSNEFVTVGAGANYLKSGSANRNAGTPSINAILAAELQQLTTTAPQSYTGTSITSSQTWSPGVTVPRDTDTPDRGYHYAPIDYAINGVTVSGSSTLTIAPGTVVATFGTSTLGIRLTGSSSICVTGTPVNLVHMTRYIAVQEQNTLWGGLLQTSGNVNISGGGTTGNIGVRFAAFDFLPHQTLEYPTWLSGISTANVGRALFRDCDVINGNLMVITASGGTSPRISLINNIFDGGYILLEDEPKFEARNNLFRGITLEVHGAEGALFQDNLFDAAELFQFSPVTHSHNAFVNGTINAGYPITGLHPQGPFDVFSTTFAYQTGTSGSFKGRYYHATTLLQDKGSRSATEAQLNVYTVLASQSHENTSTVDIGFHYVALNAGVPLDLTSPTGPDYLGTQVNGCACEYPNCDAPPIVELLAPLHGATFVIAPTNITLSAIASDPDGSITKVDFLRGGTTLIGSATTPPYNINWDEVSPGTYSITARATPQTGASVTSPPAVITVNGKPTVSILSPANGQVFPSGTASVPFTIQASDPGGSISSVKLYYAISGTASATALPAGQNYTATVSPLTNGNYLFFARARDDLGAEIDSDYVHFTINDLANLPTTMLLTAPAAGSSILQGSTVDLRTTVYPANNITSVKFYDGAALLGEDTTYPYSITTAFNETGRRHLTAKATTSAGKKVTSPSVTISVTNPPPDLPGGFWETIDIGGLLNDQPWAGLRSIQAISNEEIYAAAYQFHSSLPILSSAMRRLPGYDWAAIVGSDGSHPGYSLMQIKTLPTGIFAAIADRFQWYNNSSWTPISFTINSGIPWCSAEIGGDVLVGGSFQGTTAGAVAVNYLARVSGASQTLTSFGPALTGPVRCLLVDGDTVYIGGEFTGGSLKYLIKSVSNGPWENLGSGLNGSVWSLTKWQDKVIVGGVFTQAGSVTSANGIAVLSNGLWSGIESGVSLPPDIATTSDHFMCPTVGVYALAARGNRIYAGGRFLQANNREGPIASRNIAEAVWRPELSRWIWQEMDRGLGLEPDPIPERFYDYSWVADIEVSEGPTPLEYDVIVGGYFDLAGDRPAANIARWRVGRQDDQDELPSVSIVYPVNQTTTVGSIQFQITAQASPSWSINDVRVVADGVTLGTAIFDSESDKYLFTWPNPSIGMHEIWAVARQTGGGSYSRSAASNHRWLRVEDQSTYCSDDIVFVDSNIAVKRFDVLANDTGGPWTITGASRIGALIVGARNSTPLGNVSVAPDGKALYYRPYPGAGGRDIIYYQATDGTRTSTAGVEVVVQAHPKVAISAPAPSAHFPAGTQIQVMGSATDKDGLVSSVALYVNGSTTATATSASPDFSLAVTLTTPGFYNLAVVATDNNINPPSTPYPLKGTNWITVIADRSGPDALPVADISSLVISTQKVSTVIVTNYPTIRDGVITLSGTANDPDPTDKVAYSILLFQPSSPEVPIANLTPGVLDVEGFLAARVTGGVLGTVNLSRVPNGVYDLTLVVRGGDTQVSDTVRVRVENDFKIGRLTFSEQDAVIPVSGLPLTLIRTYDSYSLSRRDFGYGWTYSLLDMDVQFDEDREELTPFLNLSGSDPNDRRLPPVSVRSGGDYNVTLTLPGGQRTTFWFTPRRDTANQLMHAEWTAAPDIMATLGIEDGDGVGTLNFFANGLGRPVWNGADVHVPFYRYDIPRLTLTLQDKTRFRLERSPGDSDAPYYYIEDIPGTGKYVPVQPHPGQMRVVAIEQPTGDRITISPTEVSHYHVQSPTQITRKLTLVRDDLNRIVSVRDPLGGADLVRYIYDELNGDLVQVQRLVNRATGSYVTNRYLYEDTRFPHYLTGVIDPRGILVARTEYDESGRITSMVNASDRATTLTYPHTGFVDARTKARVETRDREQNLQISEADGFGNLVYTVPKDPTGAQSGAERRWYYNDLGSPTRVTGEKVSIRPPPGSGLTAVDLFRDYSYADNSNPLRPTEIVDWHSATTPAATLRVQRLNYSQSGQVTKQVDPLYASQTTVFTATSYDPITDQPTEVRFTGTVPLASAQLLSKSEYYGTADVRYGKLMHSFDAMGNVTIYDYATSSLAGSYRLGDLLSVTVREGGVTGTILSRTGYLYDDNGNVTTETQRNAANQVLRTTTYQYDARNRLIKTIDATGGVSEQKYNVAGQIAQAIDRYGSSTYTFYDRMGIQACVRHPDGTYSFTVTHYPSATPVRRVVIRTDRAAVASSSGATWSGLTGSRTYFDALGRSIKTERISGLTLVESTAGGIQGASPDLNLVCDITVPASPVPTVIDLTTTEYYDDGRTWKTSDTAGLFTTYEYSSDGLVRTKKLPNYVENSSTVETTLIETSDLNGNLIYSQVQGKIGGVLQSFRPQTRHYYDQLNRRVRTRIADHEGVADNRLGSDTGSHGVLMSATDYDWASRRIRETDADGNKTKFDYDGAGRPREVTSGETTTDETVTKFEYDILGQLSGQIDGNFSGAGTPKTTFLYDNLGRRKQRTLPGGQLETWDHDFDETTGLPSTSATKPNKIRHRDFTAATTGEMLQTYDAMGRLDLKRKKVGASWVTIEDYDYAPGGQRSQMRDNMPGATRTTKYAYDEAGRLKIKQSPEGTLSYVYDAAGDLTQVSARHGYEFTGGVPWRFNVNEWTQNNRTIGAHMSYQYDPRHRLSKVYGDLTWVNPNWVPSGLRATYSYDPVGNLARVIYGDSGGVPVATTTYTYNPRSQLRYLKTVANSAGATLASFDYDDTDSADGSGGSNLDWPPARELALSGQRRGVREVLPAAGASYPRLVGYAYDPLRRLTRESLFSGAFVTETGSVQYDGAAGYGDGTGYDKVGNRRGRTETGNAFDLVANQTHSVDYNDRLDNDTVASSASTWFDNNGNRTTFGTSTYNYDLENRLIGAQVTTGTLTMVYDGDGNRMKRFLDTSGTDVTTFYLVDDRNPTGYTQVLEEQATVGGTPTVRYVYGLDLINQDRGGTVSYYGYDGLGSVRCLINTSAAVTDTYTYDAFGIQIANTGSTLNSYRYTGEQWDAELGMYYLRARYYHPDLGRFWTTDTHEGNQSDPLSLHKYLYASANPVNNIDPSGHESLVSVSFTGALFGQLNAHYLHSSAKALGAAQRISGSTDFADLIYGLEVASIVQDKVSLVLAGVGLTAATAKVADFLSKHAYKFLGKSNVRTLDELRQAASNPESYYAYKELRQLIRDAGLSGTAQGLEAHHLLEKRFASRIGVAEGDIIAVALTPSQHRNVGQMGINIDARIMDRLRQFGTTAESATVDQIWRAHRGVYDEIGHPEWAEALYKAYFQGKGVSFY